MQRISGPTAASGGLFTAGDPSVPTPPTVVTPAWLNAMQEEIVAVILAAGLVLDGTNSAQLLAGIRALISSGGVALASDAETIAGAIATKAVTPHGAAALASDRIGSLIGGAPAALSTLKALADAIGDDPQFSGTIATALTARALAARQIATSGLASGGGDLTNDRTITVPAALFADYLAGISSTKALTPAALAAGAGSNANGSWTTLPGGVLYQWGSVTVLPSGTSSAGGSIVFPQAFPAACESITGNADDGPNNTWRPQTVVFPGGPTLNGASLIIDSTDPTVKQNAARKVWWKAIGR